jgi:hypothetical protein
MEEKKPMSKFGKFINFIAPKPEEMARRQKNEIINIGLQNKVLKAKIKQAKLKKQMQEINTTQIPQFKML